MDLNSFFPYKVCINLDRRPERWDRVQQRFMRLGIGPVHRFAAIDASMVAVPADWQGAAGGYGCSQSHLSVVREARRLRAPHVLIFEDDVVFCEELNDEFPNYVAQLPADWGMLQFGGLHRTRPVRHSENLFKTQRSMSTYAYAINSSMYDAFIDVNSRSQWPVDCNNFTLQQQYDCYCFMPHLAWVEDGYSDAQGVETRHWYLKESVVTGELNPNIARNTVIILPFNSGRECGSLQNLEFVLDHYLQCYGDFATVVVEQGQRATVAAIKLPARCEYIFLRTNNTFDRLECCEEGFKMFEDSKELFVFADGFTCLPHFDTVANLQMAMSHDFVSTCRQYVSLDAVDSEKVRAGRINYIDISDYERHDRSSVWTESCIFSRQGLLTIGGWRQTTQEMSRKIKQELTAFHSPSTAMKLN